MTKELIIQAIQKHKKALGKRLLLLAHYYQNDDIYKLADITGDSYQLAVTASESSAQFIVMCGVLFMAESTKLLINENQRAFTPEKSALCPMADMIDEKLYTEAYKKIVKAAGKKPIPLLYVNSTVATKAAVGMDNGLCCTSSNALQILKKLLKERHTVFSLPDKNLSENSAIKLGLTPDEFSLVGKNTSVENISKSAKIYAWQGFCVVHERISEYDLMIARNKYPGAKIIVHPECGSQIVSNSDYSGSTKQLLDYFYKLNPGETVIVGTEYEFVERLKRLRDDISVHHLSGVSKCVNMAKVTLEKLEKCLRALAYENQEEMKKYEVTLPQEYYQPARGTLTRMIDAAGK